MGNTNPKLHIGKLNTCTNSPEPFGPFIKYLFKRKDGSFLYQEIVHCLNTGGRFIYFLWIYRNTLLNTTNVTFVK